VSEVDWDFAYSEILRLEERKKDRQTMEAERKLEEEKSRIQSELRAKFEQEKQRDIEEVEKLMEARKQETEELIRKMQVIDRRKQSIEVPADEDKERMQQYIQELELQRQENVQAQERMLEEVAKLNRAKQDIEEKARRDLEDSNRLLNKKEEEKRSKERFKAQIKDVERKIIEANECTKFMRKNIKFSYELVSVLPEKFKLDALSEGIESRQEIQIKVQNYDNGQIYEWNLRKFADKLDEIRDKMGSYQESGGANADEGEDPFNETLEPLPLGKAYYRLEGLAYLMDNPATVSIIGQNSQIMGKLEINIIPVDADGESEIPDDMIPDNSEELVG
jgi:kinesin family member 13